MELLDGDDGASVACWAHVTVIEFVAELGVTAWRRPAKPELTAPLPRPAWGPVAPPIGGGSGD